MKLEDVTMEIRPRTDHEAIDSGFAMVRRDFWRCYMLWWMGFLPALLIMPLFIALPSMREFSPLWLIFAWWWKLTGARMVVFQLSRRLFGEQPTWRQLWRELPRSWIRRFWYRMCWARLSPWKSVAMIVEDLEELRGSAFHARVRMVMRRGEGSVVLMFFLSILGTVVLGMALLFLALSFVPQGDSEQMPQFFWFAEEEDPQPVSLLVEWLYIGVFVIAASLIDVFFTGAGFGIYVNSRTWVEGWDIELAFKRLANRISQSAGVWTLGLILCFSSGLMAQEETNVAEGETPSEMIERIKAHEDFKIHKEKYKVPKDKPYTPTSSAPASGALANVMTGIGYMLLGLVVVALIALVAWLIYRARFLHRGGSGLQHKQKARVVMGMEVTQESLPDDIISVAQRMWNEGKFLPALGLLYRGSLSWWIHHVGVEIRESDTEGDCERRVNAKENAAREYFHTLTRVWMLGAYAKSLPNESEWNDLCARWPFSERQVTR